MLIKAFFIESQMSTYFEKLRDPRWQKMRLEVMQNKEFCCEICGDSKSTLNVHHKVYFKDRNPWEYLPQQLACLCESCHEQDHKRIDPLKFFGSMLPLDGPRSRDCVSLVIAGILDFDYKLSLEITGYQDSKFSAKTYKLGQKIGELL
jgi:hypothetical protein